MKVAKSDARRARAELDNLTFDDQHPGNIDARRELQRGLTQPQKMINPKFFYDQVGSELFDEITRLPEYYPTRTEIAILQQYRNAIAARCGADTVVIEPGSGSSEKIRLLLDTLAPAAYVPLDISAGFLRQSAQQLAAEFPTVRIHAICADFAHNWSLPQNLPAGRRVVFYPGSTIGNLEPASAVTFLRRMRQWMGVDGGMLLGVDLHKSPARLNAAYNDSAGVTARFNLNLLQHVNRVLSADFDPQNFRHHAFYNEQEQRIEMHLVSRIAQRVVCGPDTLHFAQGETIHTENSYKYTVQGFAQLAGQAGLQIVQTWLDDEELFSVHYFRCIG